MSDLCPHGLPNNSPSTSEPSPDKTKALGKIEPLVLTIRNMGRVPAKKNGKQISFNRKTKKPFLRTDDEKKAWTDAAILYLESQLNSAYRTAKAMGITNCPLCWIASSVPANDSAKHIRKGSFEIVDVPEGQEGAQITITRIDEMSGVEAAQAFGKAYEEVMKEKP